MLLKLPITMLQIIAYYMPQLCSLKKYNYVYCKTCLVILAQLVLCNKQLIQNWNLDCFIR